MTNMRHLLRNRRPNGGNLLTSKPSPLTTNPSRNQAMLNHSKKINTNIKSQCVSHPPTLRTSTRKGTERNIDPLLFQTGIRTVKKLVLTSAIHDKNVTMAKVAQVSLIIRTGPTPPSEDCGATKTHRTDEFGITLLSKQRFIIAVPTNARVQSPIKVQVRGGWNLTSAHQGFIRGATALHTPASSGQHRSPVCGPTAGPRPYTYEQVQREPRSLSYPINRTHEHRPNSTTQPNPCIPEKPDPRVSRLIKNFPPHHHPDVTAWPR